MRMLSPLSFNVAEMLPSHNVAAVLRDSGYAYTLNVVP